MRIFLSTAVVLAISFITTYCAVAVVESEPNDDPEAADAIIVGDTVSASHSVAADSDFFRFYAQEGQYYRIETFDLEPSGQCDTVMELYSYNGESLTLLAEDDQSGSEENASRILWACPSTRFYYVNVFQFYSSTDSVSYKMVVENLGVFEDDHSNQPDGATPLIVDSSATEGNIETVGDVDFFYFPSSQDNFYDIETLNLGQGCDTFLRLYDSTGAILLAEDDQSGTEANASRIVWKATGEKAYAGVSYFLDAGTGTYEIKVRQEGLAVPIVADGTPVAGLLGSAGDIDIFRFNAEIRHIYSVILETPNLTNRFTASVLDTDGVKALSESAYLEESHEWLCPSAGEYYLLIRENVEGGQYDLSIADQGTAPPDADLDDSGFVDAMDLLLLGSQWHSPVPTPTGSFQKGVRLNLGRGQQPRAPLGKGGGPP